jgi:MinD superfamily P-loop ATPase
MPKPTEVAVVSGKGGTGKTVLASAIAFLASDKVTADCDVDAPDMHLLLKPEILREEVFPGSNVARIDSEKCASCGRCAEVCRFGAIRTGIVAGDTYYSIDPLACAGCGVCTWMCPSAAIEFEGSVGGKWFVSDTRFGKFVHAQLEPAQENSGRLVTLVRREARRLAEAEGCDTVIIDGPPGIGCPVIASIAGVDLAVVVTEPTVSGTHDLERVLGLTAHFGLRTGVVVNKFDLNADITNDIENRVSMERIEFLGRIPFGGEVKEAIAAGRSILEHCDGPVSSATRVVAERIIRMAKENRLTGGASEG